MTARAKGILVRLSTKEHAQVTRAAQLDGAPTATWVRRAILRRARRAIEADAAKKAPVTT